MSEHWIPKEGRSKSLAASQAFKASMYTCGLIRGCSNHVTDAEKRRGYGDGTGFGLGTGTAEEKEDGSGR